MSYPIRIASIDAVRLVQNEGPIRLRWPGSNKTTLLDGLTASAIVAVYNALSDEHKAKCERMLKASPVQFSKIASFCFKHVKI
jgi:hypothetical protein